VHLKRSLSLAGVIGVAAAILIATAGAAPGPAKPQPKLHFTTAASVLTYLKSHGINTRGIVVQRGARIYAGRKCPGKAWKCTQARRVIQFATLASSFSCSPSYPTSGSQTYPNSCTVVQVSSTGNNNAKCLEQTSTTVPSPNQYCSITQTSGTGKNNAAVVQLIYQSSGQNQSGNQEAHVKQTSVTGQNSAVVAQTIWQTTSTNSSPVNQDQNGTQTNDIVQDSASGTQLSIMSQATLQKATAGREHDDDDDDHPHYTYPGPSPFTGSQDQTSDGESHTDQSSTGVSKSYNFQNMLQIEKAPKYSPVIQSQTGPYRCCTSPGQTGNPNDVFQLQQAKLQFRSYGFEGTAGNQFESETGLLESSGHSHISQFTNQNGTTDSNSCDVNGGTCAAILIVSNGVTTTKCSDTEGCDISPPPPPPPPPPPGPLFIPSSTAPR
jgi:hypothetical protein